MKVYRIPSDAHSLEAWQRLIATAIRRGWRPMHGPEYYTRPHGQVLDHADAIGLAAALRAEVDVAFASRAIGREDRDAMHAQLTVFEGGPVQLDLETPRRRDTDSIFGTLRSVRGSRS